jgi:hypothetical protein
MNSIFASPNVKELLHIYVTLFLSSFDRNASIIMTNTVSNQKLNIYWPLLYGGSKHVSGAILFLYTFCFCFSTRQSGNFPMRLLLLLPSCHFMRCFFSRASKRFTLTSAWFRIKLLLLAYMVSHSIADIGFIFNAVTLLAPIYWIVGLN